jgi:hypothetical protein
MNSAVSWLHENMMDQTTTLASTDKASTSVFSNCHEICLFASTAGLKTHKRTSGPTEEK